MDRYRLLLHLHQALFSASCKFLPQSGACFWPDLAFPLLRGISDSLSRKTKTTKNPTSPREPFPYSPCGNSLLYSQSSLTSSSFTKWSVILPLAFQFLFLEKRFCCRLMFFLPISSKPAWSLALSLQPVPNLAELMKELRLGKCIVSSR